MSIPRMASYHFNKTEIQEENPLQSIQRQYIGLVNHEMTALYALYQTGDFFVYLQYVHSIHDIEKLKAFYKYLKNISQNDPTNERWVILVERIANLYLVPQWCDAHKCIITTPASWAKALKYAIKTRVFAIVDAIWQLHPNWQMDFCRFKHINMSTLGVFTACLRTNHRELYEMIWRLNITALKTFIKDQELSLQKNILENIIFYGSQELTKLYVDNLNDVQLLDCCARHAIKCFWNSANVSIVLERIYHLITPTTLNTSSRDKDLLDEWIESLRIAFQGGRVATINSIWNSKSKSWQYYFYGFRMTFDGKEIQADPGQCYQHFNYTLSTRRFTYSDKFWETSHSILMNYIISDLDEDEKSQLLKKITTNGSLALFREFYNIMDDHVIKKCIELCENLQDKVILGRLKILSNKITVAITPSTPSIPEIDADCSASLNSNSLEYKSSPLEPLFDNLPSLSQQESDTHEFDHPLLVVSDSDSKAPVTHTAPEENKSITQKVNPVLASNKDILFSKRSATTATTQDTCKRLCLRFSNATN